MNNKKGFTLLEVLIATGIMVSALSMLVYGIIQCFILTETTRNMDIALNSAYHKLEEVATSDLTNIMNNYNDHSFDVAGLTPVSAGVPAGLVGIIETIPDELYEVIVRIFWQQRQGRQMVRTLKTTLVNK